MSKDDTRDWFLSKVVKTKAASGKKWIDFEFLDCHHHILASSGHPGAFGTLETLAKRAARSAASVYNTSKGSCVDWHLSLWTDESKNDKVKIGYKTWSLEGPGHLNNTRLYPLHIMASSVKDHARVVNWPFDVVPICNREFFSFMNLRTKAVSLLNLVITKSDMIDSWIIPTILQKIPSNQS